MDEHETYRRLKNIRENMISRCHDEKSKDYQYYGAKGIKVCNSWLRSLSVFITWALLNGYDNNLTLDRKDGSKGYNPENCQWVTMKEQNRNRSQIIMIKIGDEEMCFKDWCDKLGLKYNSMYMRYKRGKDAKEIIEEALLERSKS